MYEVAEGSDLPWTSSCPHCLGLSNYLSYQLIKGRQWRRGRGGEVSHKETAEDKGQSFLPYDIMLVHKMFYSASLYCYHQNMGAGNYRGATKWNIDTEKLERRRGPVSARGSSSGIAMVISGSLPPSLTTIISAPLLCKKNNNVSPCHCYLLHQHIKLHSIWIERQKLWWQILLIVELVLWPSVESWQSIFQ